MLTLAGETVTSDVFATDSAMVAPPVGAGCASVIDPCAVRLNPTNPAFSEKLRAWTWTESVLLVTPLPEAVIVSLPVVNVEVTVTLAVVEFAGMVTLAGEKVTRPVPVLKLMVTPPVGARSLKVTVSEAVDEVDTVSGEGDKLSVRAGAALTVNEAVAEPAAVATVTVRTPVAAVLAITNDAVCDVAEPPAITVAVTPVPLTVMPVMLVRFVPLMVTGTVWPCSPTAGDSVVTVGPGGFTVKGRDTSWPPTLRPKVVAPVVAVDVTVMLATTEVAVADVTVPATPVLPEMTAVAWLRLVPVKVTVSVVPVTAVAGLTELKVAMAADTVNGSETVVPPTVRPKVVVAGVAEEAMTMLAVTALGLDVTIEPVTPVSPATTAVAPDRFVPLKVTVKVVPAAAVVGLSDVKVGGAALTRNGSE
jgi:hypothetical protein